MKLSAKQLAILHVLQSAGVGGAVVALYVLHRIPLDTTVGVLAGLGGFWSAVGGVLKLSGGANAATPPVVATPVASANPTAAPPLVQTGPAPVAPATVVPLPGNGNPAGPSGPVLGPEHGAPA